jgi:hypothetical protein
VVYMPYSPYVAMRFLPLKFCLCHLITFLITERACKRPFLIDLFALYLGNNPVRNTLRDLFIS